MDYLEEAYCCFLEGDDEAHQAITTEFSEARDGEDAGAEDFLRKLEENNESLAQTNQEVSYSSCGWVGGGCFLQRIARANRLINRKTPPWSGEQTHKPTYS